MFPLVHAEKTLIAIFKFVLRTKKYIFLKFPRTFSFTMKVTCHANGEASWETRF